MSIRPLLHTSFVFPFSVQSIDNGHFSHDLTFIIFGMGQLEKNLENKTQNKLTKWQRLWRCNSGSAWGGEFLTKEKFFQKFKIKIFFPVLIKLRKIILWPTGTPDMIGFDSIIITPEMVGKRVAIFVGTELKASKADKLKEEQVNFKNLIVNFGGIHREVREDGSVIETSNLKN